MFDIGSWEILLVAIIALVVIGPERLPELATGAGKFFAKINRFVTNFKDDVNLELKAEELKKTLAAQEESLGIHEIFEKTKDSISQKEKDAEQEIQADANEDEIAALDQINEQTDNETKSKQ